MKLKRRLTKDEMREIEEWVDASPEDKKPTLRQVAKRYGVNRPSVMKSFGGWDGVQRNRPQVKPKPKKLIDVETQSPAKIDLYEQKL